MKENNFFKGLFNGLIITFILFAVCFGSFMCGFQYHKEHNNLSYQASTVHPLDSVDSNLSFTSSEFYIPVSFLKGSSLSSDIGIQTTMSFSFSFSDRSLSISVLSWFRSDLRDPLLGAYSFTVSDYIYDTSPYFFPLVSTFNNYQKGQWVNNYFVAPHGDSFDYDSDLYYFLDYYCDVDFNFNVIGCTVDSGPNFRGNSDFYSTNFFFFDNLGHSFKFFIACRSFYDFLSLSPRTYYYSSNFSDNDYYLAGLQEGIAKGLADNQQNIYDEAYRAGQRVGEANGYQQGVEDSNNYTFLSLLGAVVDAPVQTFIGLLNFEILGFNFLSFLTAILTIGLIFFIIRFVFFRS